MLRLANDLWIDQAGFVVSAEMVLISTVGVIGIGTGLVCLRDAVNRELTDVACAITALDQSYCYTGFHGYKDPCSLRIKAQTAGSAFGCQRSVVPVRDPAFDDRLHPIPDHDRRSHFHDRNHEDRNHEDRNNDDRNNDDRVIRKSRRSEDTDADDADSPVQRTSQPPLRLPNPTDERRPDSPRRDD